MGKKKNKAKSPLQGRCGDPYCGFCKPPSGLRPPDLKINFDGVDITPFLAKPETAEQRFEPLQRFEPPLVPTSPAEQLRQWWFEQADREIEGTVPKAVEYSSTDLADIGHVLARTAGRTVSDEEAAELGVFFYLQGKLSRWAGAVAQGKRPSDDTIYDIGVYCRMAQRIRATGGWPGTDQIVVPNYENRSAG